MTRSELIQKIFEGQKQLPYSDVAAAIKTMIEHMVQELVAGNRIEIRGFGSFCLHYRAPRLARNPKTGETAAMPAKYSPHFKPGKELRERVNSIT
ncbi:integration host factor subunit beta [Magnetovirga frankeli]|uniref:integration host factor subunit beta n=1 Tax=Magnetovirga frankeli TaxID=947516 RepID=UPI001293842B|nr:integration host factor subunit beta [gamma proteobacterium SS-5]